MAARTAALAEATAESVGLPMAAEWAHFAAAALALEAGEPAAGARQELTTSAAARDVFSASS